MSSPCTRPCDGAQFAVEAATGHSANSKVAADESFPQLISPPRCSWACSVQRLSQLPNVCCPESSKYIVWQLDESIPLLFSEEIRSPNVKHGHDNVLTLGPPSRVCDHSFDLRQVRRLREVLVFVTITTTEFCASSEPLLTVTHLVRMTRHPFSAAADRGTTSWTPILSMKSFSSTSARWTRTGSNSSQCPTAPRMPRLC